MERDRQRWASIARLIEGTETPKTSTVCVISVNPCSLPTISAQRSPAGPATSTVRPHRRHTRW